MKVDCNCLGRIPLPLGTQEGSFGPNECFSLRQRSMSLTKDRPGRACPCGGASGYTGARECLYLCTVVKELCLCFGFCSLSALKRKLRIPGKVKTSHSVGKWARKSIRYVNEEGIKRISEGKGFSFTLDSFLPTWSLQNLAFWRSEWWHQGSLHKSIKTSH